MSRTYTPGLKILKHTTLQKTRQLPLKGSVHCAQGDTVTPETIVASTKIPGNVHMINIANLLNLEPEMVPDCMLVEVDEQIERGQVIAESKGIFGMFKSQVKSPVTGTLGNVSNVTGQCIVSEPPVPIEVNAYTSGKVVDVIPDEGLVVETECAMIQGIIGIGGERQGEIEIVVSNPGDELTSDKIQDTHKGKILIGGSTISLDAFKNAEKMGVAAVVVGGFNYSDLSNILGYTLGVAITGSEELNTTLVVTEGFGTISMAQRTFNLLKTFAGHGASINGATQIRAGVIRPELIINTQSSISSSGKTNDADLAIHEGSTVRVIRDPFFGKVGKVKSLPAELTKMESETMVRIAEIEFSDGEIFTIPRANLEMIVMDES